MAEAAVSSGVRGTAEGALGVGGGGGGGLELVA
jgi:hypothetical protein